MKKMGRFDEALLKRGVISISSSANDKSFDELLSLAKTKYKERLDMGFSHKAALRPAIRDLVGNDDRLYKIATTAMLKTHSPLFWVECLLN